MPRTMHIWKRVPRRVKLSLPLGVLFIWWLFCLPSKLFNDPTSTVTEDKSGKLLSAVIAADGQWRFPEVDEVPDKFKQAIIAFEDERFNYHPGIDPLAILRASKQNISAGRVVSGGSTLTMQVIRLSRKGQGRTFWEKLVEVFLATRLELRSSKAEILALYASHAPFGGNVVGLEAASWRYFGRPPDQLSWAEATTLAVLPNAPALIHPGRNRDALKAKRDRTLVKLKDLGIINTTDLELAVAEPLPDRPLAIPQVAPHLLNYVMKHRYGEKVRTSISYHQQTLVEQIVAEHLNQLKANKVFNAAAMVMDVETGEVLAFVGNDPFSSTGEHGERVDVIQSRRSSGSILKPLLFAAMLQDGKIMPGTLVPDIPTYYGDYVPTNYDESFRGAVPAREALARSLNVPAVRMLKDYGVERFQNVLQRAGLTTIDRSADTYGLSLILGGAEVSLWDLCGMYASLARQLNHYTDNSAKYFTTDVHPPRVYISDTTLYKAPSFHNGQEGANGIGAGAIYEMFNAMAEVVRPDEVGAWQRFGSSQKVAWKTGTSYGFRDAWAVGVTPKYVVGVWAGNADGEGRPGLTGVSAAGPILFDVLEQLDRSAWFDQPYDDMLFTAICKKSGHIPDQHCVDIDTVWVPRTTLRTEACPYHILVHLDKEGKHRVTDQCEEVYNMQHVPWFKLPPVMEWYYKSYDPSYTTLPPYKEGCVTPLTDKPMDLVRPRKNAVVYVPIGAGGEKEQVVFELSHRYADAEVHWHLDDRYIGSTTGFHQIALDPPPGAHTLYIVDNEGNVLQSKFRVAIP